MEGKGCWVMEMGAKCKDQGAPRLELLLGSMQPEGAKGEDLAEMAQRYPAQEAPLS